MAESVSAAPSQEKPPAHTLGQTNTMFKTIKQRLIAVCVAIVVGAVGVATLASYLTVSKHARKQLQAQMSDLGHAEAQAMGAWVRKQQDIVGALLPAVHQADAVPALEQAVASGRLDMAYIGHADRRMVSIPSRQRAADYDPTARPWYKLAETSDQAVLTAPYIAASSKKLVVTFARALKEQGQVRAVAGLDVVLDDVIASLNGIKPTDKGLAFLLDQEGRIIAHPNEALTFKPATDWAPELDAKLLKQVAATDTGLSEVQAQGHHYFLRSTPVPGTNWTLVLAAEREEALSALSEVLSNAALSMVAVAVLAALLVAAVVGAMLMGLGRVRAALDQIASGNGDLTQRLQVKGEDEIAGIAQAFNLFVAKIEHVMVDVRATSQSIAVTSREIAQGNQDLSQRTEESAANLEQTASSMEELTSTVRSSADAAVQANTLAETASSAASRGANVVAQVVGSMAEIQQSSHRIADIIATIDGIAFQTNILALNAAVEAARAGEQGRGFAVVATEVRALAQRSATAAREIKSLIGASVDRVELGSRQVAEAGAGMTEILDSVARVTTIMGELSLSSREQSQGIDEVNIAVGQLDQMTQQNAALVEESAAAADSLRQQAAHLAAIVAGFKLSNTQS